METPEHKALEDQLLPLLSSYDEALADGKPLLPSTLVPPSDALGDCLERLQGCLRLLEAVWPRAGAVTQAGSLKTLVSTFAAPSPPVLPSQLGRFQIEKELGRGAFGLVLLAFDPVLRRRVALKVPRPEVVAVPELQRRFLREAHASAGLDHINLVPVYEAGEAGGLYYIASAYCPGSTLAAWLGQRIEPVPPRMAALLVTALADAVEHAHGRGVLHRDIKPSNVLLVPHEEATWGDSAIHELGFTPKLTDFGLAKLMEGEPDETKAGAILGTPSYMAPEQAEGKRHAVGPTVDVYSLGATLYAILCGRPPYTGSSVMETVQQILTEEPPALHRYRPKLPRDLTTICLKCLEKEPSRRYQSAGALAADLRRFLAGEPIVARPASMPVRVLKWSRRRRALAALLVVCILTAIGMAAAGVWHFVRLEAKNVELRTAVVDANRQREQVRIVAYASQIHLAGELLRNGQSGMMSDILNRCRPGPNMEDLREFTWHYLWRLARSNHCLHGHVGPVHQPAFTPDSQLLVSGSEDRTVRVWDTALGTLRLTLGGFDVEPLWVAVSPDGNWVAGGGSATKHGTEVRIWNLRTGELQAKLKDTADDLVRLAFSPDGTSLVFGRNPRPDSEPGAVLVWSPATDKKRYLFRDWNRGLAVTLSPDGRTLAAAVEKGGRQEIRLLAFDSETEKRIPHGHIGEINDLAFSPDGQTLVSAGRDGAITLWDIEAGKAKARYQETGMPVYHVDFSRNGTTLVSGAGRNTITLIRVYDARSGAERMPPIRLDYESYALAVSPDGQMLALGCPDHLVRLIWGADRPPVCRHPAHDKEAWAVAFSPDGRTLASTSDDGTVKLWDSESLANRATLRGHDALVSCLAVSPDGALLATGSYDNDVRLWAPATGSLMRTLKRHTNAVRTVAFSPDGRLLASAGKDQVINLWDPSTGQLKLVLQDHGNAVRCVAFSRDGRLLASVGNDRQIRIWDLATGKPVMAREEPGEIWAVSFTPDGRGFVTAGADGVIKLWDLASQAVDRHLVGHQAGVRSLAFSADGQTLASAGQDKTVRLWHVASNCELISFKNLPHEINSVAFCPQGRSLAAACHDGSILVWPADAKK